MTFKLRFRFRLATRRARTSSSACPPTWLRNWNFICNCEYYLKKPLDEYESLMLERVHLWQAPDLALPPPPLPPPRQPPRRPPTRPPAHRGRRRPGPIPVSKLVVEVISQSKHSDLSYEDGLIRIEEKAPSVGIRLFSEEMLLRHAHSVVSQVSLNKNKLIGNLRLLNKFVLFNVKSTTEMSTQHFFGPNNSVNFKNMFLKNSLFFQTCLDR